jgi:hypothetical protein
MISNKVIAAAAVTAILGAALSGCNIQAPGDLGVLQSLADSWPANKLAEYAAYDVSQSGQSDSITASRREALTKIATRAAVCSGHLRVDAFTGSAAASHVVFDGDLKPDGATEIARLRKVTDLVAATMLTIDGGISQAERSLPADGSDITAQFRLAAEYGDQMAATTAITLTVDLLTDGVQTIGEVLNTAELTEATATDLANHAEVVTLPPTATVKVSGLGKTTGTQPPTRYTDALKTFYATYCRRTGAGDCVVVTDYTN